MRVHPLLLTTTLFLGVAWYFSPQDPNVASVHAPLSRIRSNVETQDSLERTVPTDTQKKDYLSGQVMVSVNDGTLEELAQRHHSMVLKASGPSGFGALAVPTGLSTPAFEAALRQDPMVRAVAPNAYIYGASMPWISSTPRANAHQWHLNMVQAPAAGPDLSDVVVAILDSGVAYENYSDTLGNYVQAPSLTQSLIVAPFDFVHGEGHANDDHQHGTHIASCIASKGLVEGVAPGTSLMPIKVLDQNNTGTELDLINGIVWATEHGADIINMSLSFGEGYIPSIALSDAIEAAHQQGIILVAAAGNNASRRLSQPAANPLVIAVAADRMAPLLGSWPTAYSNYSPRVDLLAPGGSLKTDVNNDLLKDGILAESLALNNPSSPGYWLYTGTSQAAALVSGGIAQLLHAGADPALIPTLLSQFASTEPFDLFPYLSGFGSGRLNVSQALAHIGDPTVQAPEVHYVSVLPFLQSVGSYVVPSAKITVLDANGALVDGASVYVSVYGRTDTARMCVTQGGMCTLSGSPILPSLTGDAWVLSVDTVVVDGQPVHPRSAMFKNAGLEALVQQLEANSDYADAMIALHWRANSEPTLGTLAESYVFTDLGTGLASSPMSVILSPPLLSQYGTPLASGEVSSTSQSDGSITVSLGSGLASSPMSFQLLSLNMNQSSLDLLILDGSGLASSPMSFSGQLWLSGSGLASSPMSFSPVLVGIGNQDPLLVNTAIGTDLSGSSIGTVLQAGGWTHFNGSSASSVVLSSGIGGIQASSTASQATLGTEDDAIIQEDGLFIGDTGTY